MPIETMVIIKPVLVAAGKKAIEKCKQKYREYEDERIKTMFAYVGEELNLGESTEAWDEFEKKIDDPQIHSAVVDAARKAVESFDEAPIPYIAKVVAMITAKGSTSFDDRRLIRLLSDCDWQVIENLKHLSFILREVVFPEHAVEVTLKSETTAEGRSLWISPGPKVPAVADRHDYITLFEILKKNYWGRDSSAGGFGAANGPHIMRISVEKLSVLRHLFAEHENTAD